EQVSVFVPPAESLRRAYETIGIEASTLRKVGVHEVDLRTAGAVARAIDKIDPAFVFHLAAAGVTDPFLSPDEAIRTNVYGAIHLLRAIKGRARVIALRTPGEIEASNVYAASKAAAWQFCRMYWRTQGWPVVGAMPFQVYGPGQTPQALIPSAIEAALAGRDFPMTSGRQQRDWIYIDDVIDALIAMGKANRFDFETIEIGSGVTSSVREVVELIYDLVGRGGRPLIGALPDRPGEVETQSADADAAAAVLGWRAQISLEAGLRKTIESMMNG
ncbi:MAG TPA: GDP-mannose 4,6-dehydratase, partial [Anaerolineae bacterium]